MPISRIQWSNAVDNRGKDIHVVVGESSPDLTDYLYFRKTDQTWQIAKSYLTSNNDVKLTFKPLFKTQGPQAANTHSGHNISVDTTTGVVSLTNPLPALAARKHNFIIEVEARTKPANDLIDSTIIRVQVHQSIAHIWLTPPGLKVRPYETARPESTSFRFSLRAQFDDGVVGDITDMPGITWTPADQIWSTRKIKLKAGNNTGDMVAITATLPASLGGASATANFEVAPAWDSTNTTDASIVVGGGWPGTINPDSVPNVLIIADGFSAADKGKFESYVNSLVHYIKRNPLNKPFDVLSTSMNFWTAFFPSTGTGVSVNTEVYPVGTGPDMVARHVNPPKNTPPTAANDPWDFGYLVHVVGLPVRAHEAMTAAQIRTSWGNLVDNPPSATNISDDTIESWKVLAKRGLIEPVDTELGVTVGDSMADPTAYSIINLSHYRANRDQLDILFRSLVNPRGISVKDLWVKPVPGCTPGTPGCDLPKDYDLVCILVAGQGRAVNADGYYFVSLLDNIKIKTVAGRNSFEMNLGSADIPATSTLEHGRVFVHELMHSFRIGDEYGESVGPNASFTSPMVDSDSANLTLEDDAKTGGDIHGDQIKWKWHRIRKAGVLTEEVDDTVGGGKFRIKLRLGDGYRFSVGNTVHLRFRKYLEALPKNPKISPPLEVVEPAPTSDTVHVKLKAGEAFPSYPAASVVASANFKAEFKPGSILFIPTPAPASVFHADNYPYAELVAKNIKDFITTNKKPLTAYPSVIDNNDVQNPLIDGVDLPDCFSRKRPRIIGLYSGGHTYHKGFFHPAGSCLMRESHTDGQEICAVCRYILVDIINPDEHWWIDRDLDDYYPQE